jgi:thiol-disulfide isomerase/thioredoxin
MPTLKLTTVDGRQYDLAEHRGKWVVVNFWATWCKPCLKEMPELSALDTMREHIEVVGLAYEEIEPADMQAFLKQHPASYPIAIVDTYAPPADFDTPRGLPMTYLIAPDGKVADKFLGPVTAHDIESAIAKAGGPQPTKPEAGKS